MMNKSLITNLLSIICIIIGYQIDNDLVLNAGLFAFSGAMTNWLAVHMLFEKVPGLYGSGIIPNRFEEFKIAIKSLMMEQFFTDQNLERFLEKEIANTNTFQFEPVIATLDFTPTFDSLVDVIQNSSFGGMLTMFGGTEALQPLKEPFVHKMQESILTISQSDEVQHAIKAQLSAHPMLHEAQENIEQIIDQRLSELTPQLVKVIVQKMIQEHLGWLVVWGGVFGALIGVLSSFI